MSPDVAFHLRGALLNEPGQTQCRRGSGSACRSMHGGFVAWVKGSREDGEDSVAKQIAPESHWPEMRVLILVVRKWRMAPFLF